MQDKNNTMQSTLAGADLDLVAAILGDAEECSFDTADTTPWAPAYIDSQEGLDCLMCEMELNNAVTLVFTKRS